MEQVHGGDRDTYEGMTDFSVNVNPFGPGKAVVEAAKAAMGEIGTYPDSGCGRLREALAEEIGVPGEHLIFGNGASELIFTAVLAERPGKAILPVPAYGEYEQALRAVGCEFCYYKKRRETGFALEEDFLELLNEDVDMIFLSSPDSLTGRLTERTMLWKILARCETYGIRMVVDESFLGFVENAESATILADTKRWRKLFILRTFTKMHAIPGIRLGYAVSSDMAFLEWMEQVRQAWSVSAPAQAAGLAALREKQRIKTTREFTTRERKWMEKELDKIGISHMESHANYLLIESDKDLYGLLLEKQIRIRDCREDKGLGRGYFRISMRQRGDNQRLLDALYEIQGIEIPKRKVVKRDIRKHAVLKKRAPEKTEQTEKEESIWEKQTE